MYSNSLSACVCVCVCVNLLNSSCVCADNNTHTRTVPRPNTYKHTHTYLWGIIDGFSDVLFVAVGVGRGDVHERVQVPECGGELKESPHGNHVLVDTVRCIRVCVCVVCVCLCACVSCFGVVCPCMYPCVQVGGSGRERERACVRVF